MSERLEERIIWLTHAIVALRSSLSIGLGRVSLSSGCLPEYAACQTYLFTSFIPLRPRLSGLLLFLVLNLLKKSTASAKINNAAGTE